jgi:AcrR family transcriptional regulator
MPRRRPDTPTRTYRSIRRQEQARLTRRRIIDAAQASFLEAGYTASTMRGIATAAGVTVKTVELIFGTKCALLKAVIDVAIAGDDRPIPVLQREPAGVAEAATTVGEFLALVGHAVTTVAERTASVLMLVDEAARTEPDIAALARELDAQRSATGAWIVSCLTARSWLRPDLAEGQAVDTVWLLMDPVVFRRLTRDRGWSSDDFQHWWIDGIRQLLVNQPTSRGA